MLSKWQDFLLCYGWWISHCIYLYKYHIFFIISSVNGHLCCSNVFAIVKMLQWTWECRHHFKRVISFLSCQYSFTSPHTFDSHRADFWECFWPGFRSFQEWRGELINHCLSQVENINENHKQLVGGAIGWGAINSWLRWK